MVLGQWGSSWFLVVEGSRVTYTNQLSMVFDFVAPKKNNGWNTYKTKQLKTSEMTWAYLGPLFPHAAPSKVAFPPCWSQQPDHWSKEIRLFLGFLEQEQKWWVFGEHKPQLPPPTNLPRGDCMCISKISATNVLISLSWTWNTVDGRNPAPVDR